MAKKWSDPSIPVLTSPQLANTDRLMLFRPDQVGLTDRNGVISIGQLNNVYGQVATIVAGTNVTVDVTDPQNPIISAPSGGQVNNIVAGTGISVDVTDPVNPIVATSALLNLVEDTTPQLGGVLGANSFQIQAAKGSDVASATALVLGTDGNSFDVTGTTTITSIATVAIGTTVTLHFDASLILTHNAIDLILPSGANITTAAGDIAVFYEYATGDWRCVSYTKADGTAIVGGGGSSWTTFQINNTDDGGTAAALNELLADTTTAAFTYNLPASPVLGDRVRFIDDADSGSWFTNNLTIGRNGQTINGAASDDILNVDNAWIEYVFNGTTWKRRTL